MVRRFPLVPGIDFAGTVVSSSHADWKAGDKVILNGWGVGETHHGAYAGRARVKGDWLVPLPDGMSAHDAMAVGTAGYTAMLSRHGAGAARHHARSRPGGGDRCRRRRRLGRDRAPVEARLPRHRLDRPRAESAYLNDLGAAEIIVARRTCPARPSRSPRNAGPAASMRSAATRWPMCCR